MDVRSGWTIPSPSVRTLQHLECTWAELMRLDIVHADQDPLTDQDVLDHIHVNARIHHAVTNCSTSTDDVGGDFRCTEGFGRAFNSDAVSE